MGDTGGEPLTHDERETLERVRRLSRLYVGGLVPQAAINGRRAELERLVACKQVRRYRGTGPHSRAHGRIHVYYTPCS
jgi:hypothetical protein